MKNLSILEQAFDFGRRAYLKGIPRIFHKDEKFNDLIHTVEKDCYTSNLDLMSEWNRGWDSENLNDLNDFVKNL